MKKLRKCFQIAHMHEKYCFSHSFDIFSHNTLRGCGYVYTYIRRTPMSKSVYVHVALSLENSYTAAEALGLRSMLCVCFCAPLCIGHYQAMAKCIGFFQKLVFNNRLSQPI